MPVRKAIAAVLLAAALLAQGGCGIFGCDGAAFGGCHAGTRF
ncbi:Lipoprotein [Paraburkholderia kururiensis]